MTAHNDLATTNQTQQLITIEPTKYVELVFEPFAKRLADAKTLAAAAEFDVTTTAGMAVAVKHRATFREIRVSSEKARKERKAPILEIGKLLDTRQKEIEAEIEPFESRFDAAIKAEEKRKDDEKIAKAVAESARITAIKNRIEAFMLDAVTASDGTAAEINAHATALSETVISLDEYMEFAGEAQVKRNDTVKWLRERQQQAADREAEAKRIAEERAQLERDRAAAEERDRLAAVARAEQEAKDRAERERVAAEQRAVQEKAAAELRAQQEAHAKLVREQQAEIARQQAALDAERQRQADEAARVERQKQAAIAAEAARVAEEERRKQEEMEAAAKKAERERIERERAENLAARYAPEPTGGTWSVGKTGGCIVTTEAIGGAPGSGHNDVEYYGGNLICESVWRAADAHLLAAARDMLEALRCVQLSTEWSCMESEIQDAITAALAKAEYIPTEAVELKAA